MVGLVSLCVGERLWEGKTKVQPSHRTGTAGKGTEKRLPHFSPSPELPHLPHPTGLPLV